MAIEKVNQSVFSRSLVESMKQQGQEIAKPDAVKKTSKMQSFNEAYKGFKVDTKA